ncbi:MAG: hypothetical protein A3I44_05075 [Candidatus Sungbacteria bacterium RIFCSPLOWO2_02_FULL_51_17]|nr:MAG: hypothetical protein A2676_05200 [Candidatus Sungbacteria bacterium RIFCSPHIGHO2_01_FULL_51_22]OHA07016.1 MAG: hypothetical protein A3B29_01140 [Candidatus Sungbacteria bacterium RIFCSPLOWO2_01_FULL_51_34]OHA11790.1 MAG: hypothetical protein A3I44_05075 [Candidatus Sungbacteria bacterium RIFCSPLOWO2_02_FULL_51_17]
MVLILLPFIENTYDMLAILGVCTGLFILFHAIIPPGTDFIEALVGGLLIGLFARSAKRYLKEAFQK